MTPAVIVGDELNALGIVRSLGMAEVPVIKVVTNLAALSARSKYGRKILVEKTEGESLVKALIELASQLPEKPVLFVTEEKTVRTISEHRDHLLDCYRFRLPTHERLMALMHKQGFQELAEANGAPIPSVVQLQSVADLGKLQSLTYPCVLKPSSKDYAYGARFAKAYVVQSADEAATRYREIAPVCADLVVQQWIDGGDDDIYFCLQYIGDRGVVASFTGRKLRSWPPRIGGTASCTAAWEVAEELAALTSRFFADTDFTGMGSMEFKRDRRNGRFYMIEPTVARTDFQEEVATLNGVNIPLAAYRFENGQQALPVLRPARDRAWREPLIDRWAAEQQPDTIPRGLSGITVVDAYFRGSDPMPWVQWMGERVGMRWHAIRNYLTGRSAK
jgi:D-aspartate ligase